MALTTPTVTVGSAASNRPNGLPSAMAHSPTTASPSSSKARYGSGPGGSTFKSAMSVSGSLPTSVAGICEPSGNAIVILVACPATWSLVTM